MSQPDLDARLQAADRTIALLGAMGYTDQTFPAARMEWGDENVPPDPDDIDEVWREPGGGPDGQDRWFAVTWLDNNQDPDGFIRLHEDEDAQAAGLARHLDGAS
jgi:hypothetical protein